MLKVVLVLVTILGCIAGQNDDLSNNTPEDTPNDDSVTADSNYPPLRVGPGRRARHSYHDEPPHHPKYQYSYAVNDEITGDSKSTTESRDGDYVSGQYSLVEPDGNTRTVTYNVDSDKGFQAVVHRTPPHGKPAKYNAAAKEISFSSSKNVILNQAPLLPAFDTLPYSHHVPKRPANYLPLPIVNNFVPPPHDIPGAFSSQVKESLYTPIIPRSDDYFSGPKIASNSPKVKKSTVYPTSAKPITYTPQALKTANADSKSVGTAAKNNTVSFSSSLPGPSSSPNLDFPQKVKTVADSSSEKKTVVSRESKTKAVGDSKGSFSSNIGTTVDHPHEGLLSEENDGVQKSAGRMETHNIVWGRPLFLGGVDSRLRAAEVNTPEDPMMQSVEETSLVPKIARYRGEGNDPGHVQTHNLVYHPRGTNDPEGVPPSQSVTWNYQNNRVPQRRSHNRRSSVNEISVPEENEAIEVTLKKSYFVSDNPQEKTGWGHENFVGAHSTKESRNVLVISKDPVETLERPQSAIWSENQGEMEIAESRDDEQSFVPDDKDFGVKLNAEQRETWTPEMMGSATNQEEIQGAVGDKVFAKNRLANFDDMDYGGWGGNDNALTQESQIHEQVIVAPKVEKISKRHLHRKRKSRKHKHRKNKKGSRNKKFSSAIHQNS